MYIYLINGIRKNDLDLQIMTTIINLNNNLDIYVTCL
jgi:hypothetical protein